MGLSKGLGCGRRPRRFQVFKMCLIAEVVGELDKSEREHYNDFQTSKCPSWVAPAAKVSNTEGAVGVEERS